MLNRESILSKYPNLMEDAPVYGSDGEKLGKVVWLSDDQFGVKKGIFFPKDFTLRYEDIRDVQGDEIYLNLSQSDLEGWKNENYEGWQHVDDINEGRLNATPKPEFQDRYRSLFGDKAQTSDLGSRSASLTNRNEDIASLNSMGRSTEETRVPIMEEKLEAQKTVRQAGEVNLRKVVHTELQHFTVPVMREEVRVERTPVSEQDASRIQGSGLAAGATAFDDKTVRVPVMEEEVTITKRPVVKEEVRITKDRVTEQRDVSGEVRKETVDIKENGRISKRKPDKDINLNQSSR